MTTTFGPDATISHGYESSSYEEEESEIEVIDVCPNCEHEVYPEDEECPNCGTEFEPYEEGDYDADFEEAPRAQFFGPDSEPDPQPLQPTPPPPPPQATPAPAQSADRTFRIPGVVEPSPPQPASGGWSPKQTEAIKFLSNQMAQLSKQLDDYQTEMQAQRVQISKLTEALSKNGNPSAPPEVVPEAELVEEPAPSIAKTPLFGDATAKDAMVVEEPEPASAPQPTRPVVEEELDAESSYEMYDIPVAELRFKESNHPMNKYSALQKEHAVRLFEGGMSPKEISSLIGANATTIASWAKRVGAKRGRKKWTASKVKEEQQEVTPPPTDKPAEKKPIAPTFFGPSSHTKISDILDAPPKSVDPQAASIRKLVTVQGVGTTTAKRLIDIGIDTPQKLAKTRLSQKLISTVGGKGKAEKLIKNAKAYIK